MKEATLDQGEEPNVTGDEPARGYVWMKSVWIYADAGRPLLIDSVEKGPDVVVRLVT